jgi:type I restriction enzyme S subunit
MAGEWGSARISDIANVTDYVANGSFESLRNNVTYRSEPDYAVLVRLVDHNAGWGGDFVYVDKASYDFLRKSALAPGDIVIANVGANAGTVFRVPKLGTRMTLGPNAVLCRPGDENELQRDFLYYYLVSDSGQQSLRSILSGSAQPKFNKTDFRRLSIPVPPLPEQRAITHILGTLDDKIELNRRMNETLEAMARALFKSWFVDFDPVRAKAEGRDPGLPAAIADLFPERFEGSELGEIPVGWETGSILAQARLLSGGTPKTDCPEYWDGGVLWASAKDVSQCGDAFLVTSERTITRRGLSESATQLIPALSTVVVARGATTGRMVLLGGEMAMNQTCYALASTRSTPFALYCQLRHRIDDLVHSAHGSVFDTITTATFSASRFVLAPSSALKGFEKAVSPVFGRILQSTNESRTLGALRDTLLPKLISGELRVKNAEAAAATA